MTLEEYLEFEQKSDVRHEFVAGEIYAFAGGTLRHAAISLNIASYLRQAAVPLGCYAFTGDALLKAAPNIAYYPDAVVTCDPEENNRLLVTRPCFVAEVLSPSTEMTDLREKLLVYRNIRTLQTIVYVYQDRQEVIHHYRNGDGSWTRQTLQDGAIDVPCLGIDLSLDQIYEALPD